MKDPMVVEETGEKPASDEDNISVKTSKAVIKPIDDDVKPDDKKTIAVLAEEAAVKKESVELDKTEPKPETEDESKPTDTEDGKPEDQYPGLAPDDKDKKQTKDQSNNQAELELIEQEKHDAAIQKLIDSKKYELPINSVEQRRSKRVVVFGVALSLILIVAWADIALDAGLIHISGIKPVTHFFSN